MVYIHKSRDASLAQDVLKRSLKVQRVCQIKIKLALADTQTTQGARLPLLTPLRKRGIISPQPPVSMKFNFF